MTNEKMEGDEEWWKAYGFKIAGGQNNMSAEKKRTFG